MNIEVIITRARKERYEANLVNPEKLDFGLFGEGRSVEETIENFFICLEDMKTAQVEMGKAFPENITFKFVYDTPSFLEYYSEKLSLAGLGHITGINRKQLSHYLTGHSRPSARTVRKIEKSLHEFGEELTRVNFA